MLNESLRTLASSSSNPFVVSVPREIDDFLLFASTLPRSYEWRWLHLEDFKKLIQESRTPAEENRIYWHYMRKHLEACVCIVAFKADQLTRECVHLLNSGYILAAAACCRSLLELSVMFLVEGNNLEKAWRHFEGQGKDPRNVRIRSGVMEELLHRLTHGTRVSEWKDLGNPKQTNVMAYFEKIGKNKDAAWVCGAYEKLCDMVHPNLGSHSVFFESERKDPVTKETCWTFAKYNPVYLGPAIWEDVLAPLCWFVEPVRYHVRALLGIAYKMGQSFEGGDSH